MPIISQAEQDALVLQALRRDVLSEVRTAPNYYEDYRCMGEHAGVVLFIHNMTMETITVNLNAPATIPAWI